MAYFKPKSLSKEEIQNVKALQEKYGIDEITACILQRRNITNGKDLLFYFEDDLRFQHSPFNFNQMEDAVDRILNAKEENEKVLIYGDKDVDGITSTTLLYDNLSSMGIDVSYRLPTGDDPYGLTIEAVEDFSKQFGSLIITVDNGISCINEIKRANELGIDVIVVDHHEVQQELPPAFAIINPKVEKCGYPFKDISGCAVVYKLVSALRFAKSDWYKTSCVLLNAEENENGITISAIKMMNLVPIRKIEENYKDSNSFTNTKLFSFLQGQIILVWNETNTKTLLTKVFGKGIDFNTVDIQKEFTKLAPSIAKLPLSELKNKSTIAKYGNHEPTEIGGFFNIYITYVLLTQKKNFPNIIEQEEKDLQLVAMAALADIMPMENENRIFVNNGLKSINEKRIRSGLFELMCKLNLLERKITATDLSWQVISNLNATGRLGKANLALELFLEKDSVKRQELCDQVLACNEERKRLTEEGFFYSGIAAKSSVQKYFNNLCVVIDPRIYRGVAGIVAGKLVSQYNVPSLCVTKVGDTAVGSMRTCRGVDCSAFLGQMADFFTAYGGHVGAGGFSFDWNKMEGPNGFENRLLTLAKQIKLEDETEAVDIDANIPEKNLTEDLLNVCDFFEPYGEKNKNLTFCAANLTVKDAIILGKGDRTHLKISVPAMTEKGQKIWNCMFWGEGERLNRDFQIGDKIDILFSIERNYFKNMVTPQIILKDLKKSQM